MAKKCNIIKRLNDKLREKHGVPGRITSLDEYKSLLYKLGKMHAQVFNEKTTLSVEETIKQYPEISFFSNYFDEENRTYIQGLKHGDFVFFKMITTQNNGEMSMSYNFKSFEAFRALIGDTLEFNHIYHYLVTNRHLPVVQELYKEVTGRELTATDSNKILSVGTQKEFESVAKKVLKELKSERINAGTNLDFNMRYTGKNRVVKLFFDFLHYLLKKAKEIKKLFRIKNNDREVPPLAKVVALMYMHRLTMDENSTVRKVFSVNKVKPGQDLSATVKELESLLDTIGKKGGDIPILIQIPVSHPSQYSSLKNEIEKNYPELNKKIHDNRNKIKLEMSLLPIYERNVDLFSVRNEEFDLVTWLARELIYSDDELFNTLKDYFGKNDVDSYITRFLEYYTRRLGLYDKENLDVTVEEIVDLEEALYNVIVSRSLFDSEDTLGVGGLVSEVMERVYGLDSNRLEIYAKRLADNDEEETVRELSKMILYRYLLRTPDGRVDRDFLDSVLSYAETYGSLEDALYTAIVYKAVASGNLSLYAYSTGLNISRGYVMGEVDVEDKPSHVLNVVGEFLDDNLRIDVDKMAEITGERKEDILDGKTIEVSFGSYTYVFKRHAGTNVMKVFWYDTVDNTRVIPGTVFEMSGVPDEGVGVYVTFDATADRIFIEGDKIKDVYMHLKTAEYAGLATFRHELMHINELLLEALDSNALKETYLSLVRHYNNDKLFKSITDAMLAYNHYSTRVNFLTEGIANMMFNDYTAHVLKTLVSQHFGITFDTPEDLFKQLTDRVKVAEEPDTDLFIMKHYKEIPLFANTNLAKIVYSDEEVENPEEPTDFIYGVSTSNGMISILTDDNYTYHDNNINAEVTSLSYLLKSLFDISTKVTQVHRFRFKPIEAEIYALEGASIRYFHARNLIYDLDSTASIMHNRKGVSILLNNDFINLTHRQFLSDELIEKLRRRLPVEQHMRLEELYETSLSEEELRYFEDIHAVLEGYILQEEEDRKRNCKHL